jgi:hypothetical protein
VNRPHSLAAEERDVERRLAYVEQRKQAAEGLVKSVVNLCVTVEARAAFRYDTAAAAARNALAKAQEVGLLP